MRDTFAVYIHIPFCQQRCTYCDFVTVAGMQQWIPEYIDALCKEIVSAQKNNGEKQRIQSIFFGGGTPSILPTEFLKKVFTSLHNTFIWDSSCEITIETNPGTLELAKLTAYRDMGINRLSIGMQSANDDELRLLGRIHDFADVQDAVKSARMAGFENISFDLIYGLPNQSLDKWKTTLAAALDLYPQHISCYSLTVEEGTPLWDQVDKGLLPDPDDDIAADMLEYACSFLDEKGFAHYEISNWAKNDETERDLRSRHNLQYWHNDWYYGFGVGAHGYLGDTRIANTNSIEDYMGEYSRPEINPYPTGAANISVISISEFVQMQEELMLRLRLLEEGVTERGFFNRYRIELFQLFGDEITELSKSGLLIVDGVSPDRKITLTHRGLFLGNQVFQKFVGEN